MFIKVTGADFKESTILVNTDKVYCVTKSKGETNIVFIDDSCLRINESIDEVERMLKGADDD